tara:strand:+ start:2954 stop:5227 length:2274 start_codon:yes stop_codon:yes gene_type:complete
MKITEVHQFPKSNRTASILTEGYKDLTETQRVYLGRWEKELWPLLEEFKQVSEANLTADEIQSIFKGAETQSIASGDNKTALGKVGSAAGAVAKLPVDLAKKVDAKINELGRMAQNAGPVKNMDQKFDELKKKIEAENSDSKIVQGIKKVSDWAKENPGKASIAVGILTTVAAFAGGPLGGAAAGLVLRSTKDLLQGEKLSTAVGKSVKTAAYGALAGASFKFLSQDVLDNFMTSSQEEWLANKEAMEAANAAAAKADIAKDFGFDSVGDMNAEFNGAIDYKIMGNYNGFSYNYDVTIAPEYAEEFKALNNAMNSAKDFSPADYKATAEFHSFMRGMVDNEKNKLAGAIIDALREVPKDSLNMSQVTDLLAQDQSLEQLYDKLGDTSKVMGAALQGAMQTVDDTAKNAQKTKPADQEELKQLELDFKGGEDNPADDKVAVRGTESVSYADAYEHLYEQYLTEAPAATATADAQGELPLNNPNTLGAKAGRGIKGALGKVGGAIKKGASAVGGAVKSTAKELGQKITVKKLNSEWEKMGSPTDSGSIYNLLSSMGISNDNIQAIGQEANVSIEKTADGKQPEAPATATTPDAPAGGDTAGGTGDAGTGGTGDAGTGDAGTGGTGDAGTGGTGDAKAKDGTAPAGGQASATGSDPKNDGPFDMKSKPPKGTNAGVVSGDFEWKGAQWINTKTGKIADKGTAAKLGNPKIAELAREIEKAGVGALVKDQISAPGVKAGTPQAAVAKKVVSKAAQAQGATA